MFYTLVGNYIERHFWSFEAQGTGFFFMPKGKEILKLEFTLHKTHKMIEKSKKKYLNKLLFF